MDKLVDLHILHKPRPFLEDWHKEKLEQTLKTLSEFPEIQVFEVTSVFQDSWNFLAARAEGYSLGTSRFVSNVGSDDDILHEGLEKLLACASLKNGPKAIFSNSYVEYSNGERKPLFTNKQSLHVAHEIALIDREVFNSVKEAWIRECRENTVYTYFDQILYYLVSQQVSWEFLSGVFSYVWYKRAHGVHTKASREEFDYVFNHRLGESNVKA